VTPSNDTWQLIFIDVLFLCLAGSLGWWFRAWLNTEKRALDERLTALDEQQAHLERLSGRLLAACRLLESSAPIVDKSTRRKNRAARKAAPVLQQQDNVQPEKADRYERARQLLGQGVEPVAVARQLELGMAEVELMARMLQHRDKG
jgi:hypothetical protein